MARSIKDIETEQLARTLERRTGESITLATKRALEERLRRTDTAARRAALLKDLEAIQRRWNAMPVLDGRSSDDVFGYDEDGLPSSDFSQTDIPAA